MVKLLLFLLLLIFPLGQLTRLPFNGGEVGIYLHDFIVPLIVIVWLIKKFRKKEKFFCPKLTNPIFGFIFFALFSLLMASPFFEKREIFIAFLYLVRWFFYSLLFFVSSDMKRSRKIIGLMINVGIAAAVFGLIQYIFIPDIRMLMRYDWDPHYYRVVGTYLDPGYTGMIFVLTLILILQKIGEVKKKNFFLKTGFFVVYVALALTYSRSAYLAYLTAMVVFSWLKKSKKLFFKVLVIGALTLLLLPRPGGEGVKLERRSTIWARIENWQQSLKIGWDNPLFGIGFNAYRYAQRNYSFLNSENWQQSHAGAGADSSIFFVFSTTGVLGLITYFVLIGSVLVYGIKKKLFVVVSSTCALLVHSFFANSLFYAWIMLWCWIIWGQELRENK